MAGVIAPVNAPCNAAARERLVSDELEKRVRLSGTDTGLCSCARVTYDRAIILF